MGKNKLAKFADMADFPHVFQYPFSVLQENGFLFYRLVHYSFRRLDAKAIFKVVFERKEYLTC